MTLKIAFVMDDLKQVDMRIESTSYGMMLEAQRRGWQIYYLQPQDIFLQDDLVLGSIQHMHVKNDPANWYVLDKKEISPLHQLDLILMRKDPPIDLEYIYTTQLLDLVNRQGGYVLNNPQALRDFNEKLAIALFPQCCAPTRVTCNPQQIKEFLHEQHEIVCKPLHGKGGQSIFRLHRDDLNFNVIMESLNPNGNTWIMAQRFIPEISQGDKRIILIDGEPMPYALARYAPPDDFRANLHAGAKAAAVPLSQRDQWICAQIGPFLKEKGLFFVGLDVIGDYVTEINITSPGCMLQLEEASGVPISKIFWDKLM